MSVKEFWEDDPNLFWAYRFSYYERLRINQDIFNSNAWLQGAYFNEAVSVALCNAFSKSKVEYSKQPYGFNENKPITEEEKQKVVQSYASDIKARISQVNAIRSGAEQQEVIKGKSRV
ncbi:MAG: hypothetical protein V8Q75_03245 [Bacilli bacterium]